jgi:hypothetical protein
MSSRSCCSEGADMWCVCVCMCVCVCVCVWCVYLLARQNLHLWMYHIEKLIIESFGTLSIRNLLKDL